MSFIDSAFDLVCDLKEGISAIPGVVSELGGAVVHYTSEGGNYIKENPGKTVTVVAGTVVTGGVGFFAAPALAAGAGSLGLLGAASTGTTISTLSGAALTNASLAALGGGALAAGGGGMATGAVVVAGGCAAAGAGASTVLAKKSSDL